MPKEWPNHVSLNEPRKDYSFSTISKYLYEYFPLTVSPHSDLEKGINVSIKLEKPTEKMFSLQCGPAYLEEYLMPLNRQTDRHWLREVL